MCQIYNLQAYIYVLRGISIKRMPKKREWKKEYATACNSLEIFQQSIYRVCKSTADFNISLLPVGDLPEADSV